MKNNSINEKNENLKNDKKLSKSMNLFKKNKALFGLVIITLAIIIINQYDKKNNQPINTFVDLNLATTLEENKASEQKALIFIYNPITKTIEEKEVNLDYQANIIEGDFVTQIIQNSDFSNKNLKFQSAYSLDEDGKKVLKVILNSEFMGIKGNQELYNGFSKAVSETLKRQDSTIQDVEIQIDGDKLY